MNFVGTLYSFGATLSFTVAHVSLVRLADEAEGTRPRRSTGRGPTSRSAGVDWPVFAIVGGHRDRRLVPRDRRARTRPRAGSASAGSRSGLAFYVVYRRRVRQRVAHEHRQGAARVRACPRARVPAAPRARRRRASRPTTRSTSPAASRPSAAPGSWRSTCSRFRSARPLDDDLAELEDAANDELDEAIAIGDSYGVRVLDRLVRARSAGPAIVEEAERRGTEIIVIGTPRKSLTRDAAGRVRPHGRLRAPARSLPGDGRGVAGRGAGVIWYRRAIFVFSGVLRPDRPRAARRHGDQRRRPRRVRARRAVRRARRRSHPAGAQAWHVRSAASSASSTRRRCSRSPTTRSARRSTSRSGSWRRRRSG